MGISLGTTGRVRLTIIFALFCFLIPSNSSAEDFRVNIEGTLGDVEGTFGSDFEFADGQDFIATLFFSVDPSLASNVELDMNRARFEFDSGPGSLTVEVSDASFIFQTLQPVLELSDDFIVTSGATGGALAGQFDIFFLGGGGTSSTPDSVSSNQEFNFPFLADTSFFDGLSVGEIPAPPSTFVTFFQGFDFDADGNQIGLVRLNPTSIEVVAIGVPEPSSSIVFCLAGIAIVALRKRKIGKSDASGHKGNSVRFQFD